MSTENLCSVTEQATVQAEPRYTHTTYKETI